MNKNINNTEMLQIKNFHVYFNIIEIFIFPNEIENYCFLEKLFNSIHTFLNTWTNNTQIILIIILIAY